MVAKRAQLHVQLKRHSTEADLLRWQTFLREAALQGYAKHFRVGFNRSELAIVLSVPYEDDGISLLEAGVVLGYCLARIESSGSDEIEHNWLALKDAQGQGLATIL